MTPRSLACWLCAGLFVLSTGGCDSGVADVPEASGDDEVAVLLHVTPRGGADAVDPSEPVVIEFAHPVHPDMAEYASVHEGDVNGPEVPGSWSLSAEGTSLVFTQAEPLEAATTYVIHLGGAMHDVHGHGIGFEEHGPGMGGEWAWEEMFEHMGSGMGHGMGPGGGFEHPHMDEGWRHENGSFGMVFTFTTAA